MVNENAEYPERILFFSIVKQMENLAKSNGDDVLSMLDLINKNDYKRLRKQLNNIFQVGDPQPVFNGPLGDETEFGDFTDLMQMSLIEQYPPDQVTENLSTFSLNISERKAMRDSMLNMIDTRIQE